MYHVGMTDDIQIISPPGHGVVRDGNTIRIERHPDELLTHPVSARLTARQMAECKPFFEVCGRPSDAIRYLLEHPDVKAVMAARVAAASRRKGADNG